VSVYFHHGSWWIDVTVKGRRIKREGGFKTELDAKVAERDAKDDAEVINTDFIRLCESLGGSGNQKKQRPLPD
jgi:hypothetical protein